jgi:hypothetical protein
MRNRIISTVGKHIVAQEALAGRYQGIRVEESTYFGIVISGLEIVQLRLYLMSEAILPILRDFRVL